jgi:hypothetical protein
MQWMRRYDSCATHDHFQRLRFRRACVQPWLIVSVSRLAVSSDITEAMGAMQEAELVVTA